MKGLGARKTADAIAAFVREHGAVGPRRAVLCTYDFDPVRFEAVILPALTRRRWFRTLVLADGAALQKEGVLEHRASDSGYELAPVRLRGAGVFHPKLVVVQAGARVLVGVGSGNLTAGGLGGNLELMLFASNDTADGRALAASAIQFLDDLRQADAVVMPRPVGEFLSRLCASAARNQGGPILHSLDQPLIGQIEAGRPRAVERAVVVSPWHSSSASPEGIEPAVLQAVSGALGARPVVHTEGERMAGGKGMKGPRLGSGIEVRVLKPTSRVDDADLDASAGEDAETAPRRPARLHAKAYLAAGQRGATLWFGSANCTTPALLRSARRHGNVELLVKIALDRKALAAIDADLEDMFEDKQGELSGAKPAQVPRPRGQVLTGYVSQWGEGATLILELAPSPAARAIRVARTAKLAPVVTVRAASGASSIELDAATTARLFGAEPSPVLWEQVGSRGVAFPVSVPCVPITEDAEIALDDALSDLWGRIPAAHERTKRRLRDDGELDTDGDEERDAELALLTRTEHQGRLDRIAVRVELLRRHLASGHGGGSDARAPYREMIARLGLEAALQNMLLDHLGAPRGSR